MIIFMMTNHFHCCDAFCNIHLPASQLCFLVVSLQLKHPTWWSVLLSSLLDDDGNDDDRWYEGPPPATLPQDTFSPLGRPFWERRMVLHMVEEIAMSMTMKVLNMVREIVMIMAIYDGGYANVEQVKHECLLSNQKDFQRWNLFCNFDNVRPCKKKADEWNCHKILNHWKIFKRSFLGMEDLRSGLEALERWHFHFLWDHDQTDFGLLEFERLF